MTLSGRSRATRSRAIGAALTTLVAVFALTWIAERPLEHGVTAHWWADVDGELRFVRTVVEHRPSYPNVHRALSRVAQGWHYERDGVPPELFEFRARLVTRLDAPRAGRLRLDASGDAEVRVDGRRGTRLSAGPHDVVVDWRGDFDRPTHLRWQLCDDDGTGCEPIDAGAFRPDRSNPLELWLWLFALLLGLPLAWAVAAASVREGEARWRWIRGVLLALIVIGGAGSRLYDYEVMPELRENGDELFATWNGWQLLEDGTTVGWSMWAGSYGDRVTHERLPVFGQDWHLIRPYFEHPPLMHVFVGAAAHLSGASHFAHAKLRHTRLVPIAFNLLTIVLIYLLARRLEPRGGAAHLAALLYAFLPTTVLQSRVIKEEALLVPLALLTLLLFLKWRTERKDWVLFVAATVAGVCTLAKVPGFAFVIALGMLVAAEGVPFRKVVGIGAIGLAVSALLPLFALASGGWESFRESLGHQSARPVHFNIFSRWFDVTLVNHNVVGRGWMLFLWLGTVAGLAKRSRTVQAVVGVPLVLYMAAIALGSGSWTFGWYSMPLVPFLCVGAGAFLADLWRKPHLFGGALVALLLVMYTLNFTFEPAFMKAPPNWPQLRRIITGTIAVLLAPWALAQVWPRRATERFARAALVASIAIFVVIGTRFVVTYETGFESYENFDRDVYFDR